MDIQQIEQLRNEQQLPQWGLPKIEGENWEKAAASLPPVKKKEEPKWKTEEYKKLKKYMQQIPSMRLIPPITTQSFDLDTQRQIQDYYSDN